MVNMAKKLRRLKEILAKMESALIAYSGGVDSTFLVKVAGDVLDNKVIAAIAVSLTYPSHEAEDAKRMVRRLGVRHIVIKTDELSDRRFVNNSQDRCYWCKKELFAKLTDLAKEYKLNYVLDGSNYDDTKDFRPGTQAAREYRVRSPLKEAGFTKKEIRSLSKRLGLSTWDKPSLACLASRFPFGSKITKEDLVKVDKAERFLKKFGITQVRVRHYDHAARIEVLKHQIPKLLKEKARQKIIRRFKELGYSYVSVDLVGYRTGSMNPVRSGSRK